MLQLGPTFIKVSLELIPYWQGTHSLPGLQGLSQATLLCRLCPSLAFCVQTQATLLCCIGLLWLQVGQLFSSRSDLFPAAFTEELSRLQDRVPAFNPKKAIAIVEAEFGAPVSQLYRSFEELPLAAASLGQVTTAGAFVPGYFCALSRRCWCSNPC